VYNNVSKIPLYLSKSILTIGPDHLNHRGGIGSVIKVYTKYFEKFKFIPSYKNKSILFNFIYFIYFIFNSFKNLIVDKSIKIIHIHGASRGSFLRKFIIFFIAKFIFKKKIIYHIHGAEYHLFFAQSNFLVKKLIQLFINNSDVIICLSEFWKSFFDINFKIKKLLIIPNIIDYPIIIDSIKVNTYCTFLFLGQIGYRKGIFDLLNIISINKAKYKGKIKLFVGGNGNTDKLFAFIKENNIEDIVEFIGWVDNEKKTYYLQMADIYILPSYNEGLPISILEAMSYGKAIISTNVGGIPEIVINGKNGILIEPGNLKDIEYSIDFFIRHPDKINTYGIESKLISKKYMPDQVMDQLSIIYNILLNE
jgi:glycosyltransferase involved in cell wall biosynthesis